MFKKKKKEEVEEILPEPEGVEDTGKEDYAAKIEEINAKIKALDQKATKAVAKAEPKGEFSLSSDEMALAVNALASSEEFKLYQQMVIGQQIAEIITSYNKAIGEKSEVPSDTEETLPEPT